MTGTLELLNFLKEKEKKGISLNTLKTYYQAIKTYIASGAKDLKEFRDKLLNEGKNPKTINLYLKILSQIYKQKIEKIKEPSRLPRYLNEEEIKEIFMKMDYKTRIICKISLYTGLRLSEIENLKYSDIINEDGIYKIKIKGKGNKERIVYFVNPDSEILNHLQQNIGKKEYIMSFSKNYIQKKILKISKKTGIDFTFHSFRHTFATNLLGQGFSLEEVQKLLGHSNVLTTQIYAYVKDIYLENKIKNLIRENNEN
jgi:integrase/recombinase XerD